MTSLHQENQSDSSPVCHTALWKPHSGPILSKESIKNLRESPGFFTELAELGPRVNNAIHWTNRYPVDRCWQNKLQPVDCLLGSDLSGGRGCHNSPAFSIVLDYPLTESLEQGQKTTQLQFTRHICLPCWARIYLTKKVSFTVFSSPPPLVPKRKSSIKIDRSNMMPARKFVSSSYLRHQQPPELQG